MLEFALEYRQAVDKFTGDRDLDLRRLELDDEEWELASQLRDVLKIFWDASQFFSRGDGSPLVCGVIPAMDHIDESLTTYSINNKYCPAIRSACALAKKTLNRYYSKTDDSVMYRICLMLHPSYKTAYFKRLKWPTEWIDAADEVVHSEWYTRYAHIVIDPAEVVEEATATAAHQPSVNVFDDIMQFTPDDTPAIDQDELDTFLTSPCEDTNGDPLAWWMKNRARYPRLSRMALDYLSAPATTVDVERVFSQGRLVLSHTRNRLSPKSMRALMCVGAWSRAGLLNTKKMAHILRSGDKNSESLRTLSDHEDEDNETWANVLRVIAREQRRSKAKGKGKTAVA